MPTAPDTIVLVHGLWMTPRSWEEWVPYYEGKGFKVVTPTYPGFEVEVEALRANDEADRDRHRPGHGRQDRRGDQGARHVADHHGPLLRRDADAAPARPWTRLLCVVIDSAPTEGVHVRAAVADQVVLPGAQEPEEPAPGGRVHAGGVPLRVHEHAQPRGLGQGLGALRDSRARQLGLGLRPVREPQARPPGDLGRTTRTRIARRCSSSAASEDHIMPPSVNKSNAKHYELDTPVLRVRGPRPLDVRRARLGGGCRPRARVGGRERPLTGEVCSAAKTKPAGTLAGAQVRADLRPGGRHESGRLRDRAPIVPQDRRRRLEAPNGRVDPEEQLPQELGDHEDVDRAGLTPTSRRARRRSRSGGAARRSVRARASIAGRGRSCTSGTRGSAHSRRGRPFRGRRGTSSP